MRALGVVAVAAVTVAVTAAAGGCGGKKSVTAATAAGSSRSASPPASAAPSTPTITGGGGACELFKRDEATRVLGTSVMTGIERKAEGGPVPGVYCIYSTGTAEKPPILVVAAFDLGSNARATFGQFKAKACASEQCQAVAGIGDEAYFKDDALAVRSGHWGVATSVVLVSGDKSEQLERDKAVAAAVLSRLR